MPNSPFALAAPALIGMGYSPIPIAPRCIREPLFDGDNPPGGQTPGRFKPARDGKRYWFGFKQWKAFCKRPAHPSAITDWASWPDAGVGVCCGYGGLLAIDVDHPYLIEPIRAILPPILVEKFGRKGFTAFFRSEHPRADTAWWKKKNYGLEIPNPGHAGKQKRVGLLDFLGAGSQTVVPPTSHPKGGHYVWTTERTLLNTPLEALPLFTDAHREAMEEVLRRFGWDAPEPRVASSRSNVKRPVRVASEPRRDDVNDAALNNLSAWVSALGLPKTRPIGAGYRAVAPWRSSGSGRPGAQRGTNLSFHPDGIVDFGTNEGFTPVGVVAKARDVSYAEAYAWLRAQLGLVDTPAPAPQVQATYPDRRVPLDIGEWRLKEAIAGFETVMREWRDIRAAPSKTRIVLDPPVRIIKIEAGGGKTHETAAKIAAWLPQGYRIAVAVPDHDLARQVARTIGAHGVSVEIYRGYTQPDPLAPEHKMCRNLPAYRAAYDLGISIRSAVCERCEDGKIVRCDFINDCGRERQRELKPDVWVLTRATLLYERPDFIAELDGLVIDEKFFDVGIGKTELDSDDDDVTIGKSQTIDVAVLRSSKIEGCNDEEDDFLTTMRHRLFDAVKSNDDGFLTRRVLNDAGISADDASKASVLEQRRVTPKVLTPGMADYELNSIVRRHKSRNKDARAAGAVWEEIETLLGLEREASGRLKIAGSKITVTQHRPVHPSWHTAILALDATAASSDVLVRALFGDVPCPDSVNTEDIAIRWSDCVHVRQVLSAPVAKNKVGLVPVKGEKPDNERDLLRFIRWRAAVAAPAQIGLISYKQFIEKISDHLPANVIPLHFGALAGRNDLERVRGLVVVGQNTPKPADVEHAAAVLTGLPVATVADYWFPLVDGGITLADGDVVATKKVPRHPDPIVEEMRWQVTEREQIQAVGRLRPLRRSEKCWVDILSDIPLPVSVHETVQWKAVCPGAEADMAFEGVILTNSRDAFTVFGVKDHQARKVGNCVGLCNIDYITETHTVSLDGSVEKRTQWSPVRFRYRRGERGPKSEGLFLPAIMAQRDLQTWLETKLGGPVNLEIERRTIEHPAQLAEWQPETTPLGELVRVFGGWLGEEPTPPECGSAARP